MSVKTDTLLPPIQSSCSAAIDTAGTSGEHVDQGALRSVVLEGRAAIRQALEQGSAMGIRTRVERVVTADDIVVAQICDAEGCTFLTSFWHVSGGVIQRDVSIVARSTAQPS